MNAADFVIVLTTFPAAGEAMRFATTLVEERLAACVNVQSQMQSVYRWQGRIHCDPELQIVIKTTRDRLAALQARVRALHPYEVPEFLVVPVLDGSEAYLCWVRECTDAGGVAGAERRDSQVSDREKPADEQREE